MNVIFFGWAYLKVFSALEKSDPELFFFLLILISLVSILADQVKLLLDLHFMSNCSD